MHNYEHKKLIETITKLDEIPAEANTYSDWIRAKNHLSFLHANAQSSELVIYASGEFSYIHSVVVPHDDLFPIDKEDLMNWSMNPYCSIASYVMGGGRKDIWIERGLSGSGTNTLKNSMQLIFGRTFEGWTGSGRNYYELHQEYAHLSEIHWRPEKRAYCRFDENGDIEAIVSITTREDKESNVSLVSFRWEPLEEYLIVTGSSLVRLFDFPLFRSSEFNNWPSELPQKFYDSENIFFHQLLIPNTAAYTRGVQIIGPRRQNDVVFSNMEGRWFGKKNKKEYVEFVAYDWRNKKITKISTDPNDTANFFNAESNLKPFELSPAFFRPEVLLKYKADRDKYTLGEREIMCRASWYLRDIDVNEAGQVHAYICDLRRIPYSEQLHWLSFNEEPKAGISNRAFINDFKGDWVDFMEPLQEVKAIIRRWHSEKVAWWVLRNEDLLDRANTPLTESRDEWGEAFMDLAKLVVEGFETKSIRERLDDLKIAYNKADGTIALLEYLFDKSKIPLKNNKLNGLRAVQFLRTKIKGHVSGSEAEKLAQDALMEYETFGNHFRHICTMIVNELEVIEQVF